MVLNKYMFYVRKFIICFLLYASFTQFFSMEELHIKTMFLAYLWGLLSTILLTWVQNQLHNRSKCQTNEDEALIFVINQSAPGKHFLGCGLTHFYNLQRQVHPVIGTEVECRTNTFIFFCGKQSMFEYNLRTRNR